MDETPVRGGAMRRDPYKVARAGRGGKSKPGGARGILDAARHARGWRWRGLLGILVACSPPSAQELLFGAQQWGNVNLRIEQSSDRVIESVLASNPNFEPLASYPPDSGLRRLSKPVGRLDVRLADGRFYTCTASLVGIDIVLTNYHCVPGDGRHGNVAEVRLLMGYYSETDTTGTKAYDVRAQPLDGARDGDYSILKVDGQPEG